MNGLSGRMARVLSVLMAIGLMVLWALPAGAVVYDIDKDPDRVLYGNLNQADVPVIGQSACGPTSAVNSFVYLENKYPSVYGNSLVPAGSAAGVDYNGDTIVDRYDDMAAVAEILGGANYMNTKVPGGTYDDMFIEGKYLYLESVAPGMTEYAAQMSGQWAFPFTRPQDEIPQMAKPVWVEDLTIPTWQFLWDNLVSCEDIEILITDGDWGHFLTLTSFHWNDSNNDNIMQQTECGQIDYMDPATGAWGCSPIWQTGLNSQLFVGYGTYEAAQLVMAVKESPVPEPASLMLVMMSILCLVGMRRTR